jgi:hypothetical protein
MCLIQGALGSASGIDELETDGAVAATSPTLDDDFGRYRIIRVVVSGTPSRTYDVFLTTSSSHALARRPRIRADPDDTGSEKSG